MCKQLRLNHNVRPLMLITLLAFLAVGCQSAREYFSYSRTEPSKQYLVGTWTPDESSLLRMRKNGGYEASVETKLVLKDDRTFELTNMPDWWGNGFGTSNKAFLQYSGTWGTSQNGAEFWDLYLNTGTDARSAQLLGQEPPYEISFFIGDPDSDNRMVFVRR